MGSDLTPFGRVRLVKCFGTRKVKCTFQKEFLVRIFQLSMPDNDCILYKSMLLSVHAFFKLNSLTVSIFPLTPSRIFHFNLLPFPVHPTGFSFYIFPGFLVIFILLSSNNNKIYFLWSFPAVLKCLILARFQIPAYESVFTSL